MTALLYSSAEAAGPGAPASIDLARLTANALQVVLPNGFTVVLKRDPSVRVTAVHLRVKTGSIHEEGYYGYGLSHFFEHSMFLGSQRRPKKDQFSAEIESYGGANVNAYTTQDHTAYHFTVLSEFTLQALDCIEDLVLRPLFPEADVKNEMGSIQSEMDMRLDQPDSAFNEFLSRVVFEKLPYQYPVIGFKERFSRLTREELLAYYRARYVPNNMVLGVVGNFDTAEVLKKIEALFGGHPARPLKDLRFAAEAPFTPLRAEFSHPKATFTRVSLLWRSVDLRHPDMYPLDVLSSVLASGKGSILHDRIKEELGLVESISASSWTPEDTGLFEIGFALPILDKPAAVRERIDLVEKKILEALAEIAAGQIDEYRLESVKREVLSSFVQGRETSMGLARSLAASVMVTGGLNYDSLYVRGVQQVTKAEVVRVAKTWLQGKTFRRALLLPHAIAQAGILYPDSKTEKDLADAVVQPLPPAPRPEIPGTEGAAVPIQKVLASLPRTAAAVDEIHPTERLVLGNGLTLLYRREARLPVVHAIWASRGGLVFENGDPANGSFALLTRLFTAGTDRYPKADFVRRLRLAGVDLSPFGGKASVGYRMHFLRDRLAEGADLFAAVAQNTGWKGPDFEVEKKSHLFSILARRENAWSMSSLFFRKKFFAGSPLAQMEEGDEDPVRKLQIPDLSALKTRFMNPAQTVVAIYGDLTKEELQKHFISWLEQIPATPALPVPATKLAPVHYGGTQDILKDVLPGSRQAYFRMAWRVPDSRSKEAPALKVANGYLSGMGGPLFKLRSAPFDVDGKEVGGRAYQLGSFYDGNSLYGAMVFYAGLRYEARGEAPWAVEAFRKETKRLAEKPLSAEELRRARVSVLGAEIQSAEQLENQAFEETLLELIGQGYAAREKNLDALAKVTAADVQAVAKKYLADDRFLVHVLVPEK
ncbi:MAG: insulinase family protein [Spirochaetes bacterium]|nr:insulinase family protein [Spirochaetota bacterium]